MDGQYNKKDPPYPYNYAFDNPVFYIDPDGMEPIASFGNGGLVPDSNFMGTGDSFTGFNVTTSTDSKFVTNLDNVNVGMDGKISTGGAYAATFGAMSENLQNNSNADLSGGCDCPPDCPTTGSQLTSMQRGNSSLPIGDSSSVNPREPFSFGEGKSPFEIKTLTYFSLLGNSYSYFEIQSHYSAPDKLKNQSIKSENFYSSTIRISRIPIEIMSGTRGRIFLAQPTSGASILQLFNSTSTIKTISASSLLKYNMISGYDSYGNLLWYSHTGGGGVITLGVEYSKYNVNFKE